MNRDLLPIPSKTGLHGLRELRDFESLTNKGAPRNLDSVTPFCRNPVSRLCGMPRSADRGYTGVGLQIMGYAASLIGQGLGRCVTHVTHVTLEKNNVLKLSGDE